MSTNVERLEKTATTNDIETLKKIDAKDKKWSKVKPWVYLLPFLIGIVVFTLYPIFNVFIISFKENFNYINKEFSGYGLANYIYIFKDPYFIQALKNTFMYVFIVIPVSLCISVVIAYLLNQKIKFKGILQTAYFLPMVTSTIAVGLAWKFMFNYRSGVINYLLNCFGFESINWLQVTDYNFIALCIYGIWSILPFTIILLLSGLQNIDPLYYTAAKVDGASSQKIFFRITLPLLKPTIFMVLVINTISCFKVFNELFPLFNGPGVSSNLFTVVYYIFYQFRVKMPGKYGYAAAAAVILFFIIFIFTMIQKYLEKKTKE